MSETSESPRRLPESLGDYIANSRINNLLCEEYYAQDRRTIEYDVFINKLLKAFSEQWQTKDPLPTGKDFFDWLENNGRIKNIQDDTSSNVLRFVPRAV